MTVPNSDRATSWAYGANVMRTTDWHRQILVLALAVLAYASSNTNSRAQAPPVDVDLALVLAIDISHSVDWWEYRMQREGLAFALRDPKVLDAIRSGPTGRVAITVVQWSGWNSQGVAIPWTVLSRREDTQQFSERVARMLRIYGGMATHIGGVIRFATRMLAETPFEAGRKVIDISGDGYDNITKRHGFQRDQAIAAGITINGLAIENEEKDLRRYYRTHIIGGPGAFVMPTARYQDFGIAMRKKLIREISFKLLSRRGVPASAG